MVSRNHKEVRTAKRYLRGTLILEALISFMLFFVFSLTAYGLLANSRRGEAKARQNLIATAFAREKMEELRAQSFEALPYGSTKGTETLSGRREDVSLERKLTYVTEVNKGPLSSLKHIVVTVYWEKNQLSLESYLGQ